MHRIPLSPLPAADDHLELNSEMSHYVGRVLRVDVGDELEIFDGEGHAARCRVEAVGKRVALRVKNGFSVPELKPVIRLYQAIPKGDRWRTVLEKATELGVSELRPIVTERSVVRIPQDRIARKMERWRTIVRAASRQSHRYHTPSLFEPLELSEALGENPPPGVYGALDAHARLESVVDNPCTELSLWIGPEGGWTADERALLGENGHVPVALGDTVLRSETAGVFSVGLARYLLGKRKE